MPVTTDIQTGGAGVSLGVWANYPNSYNLKGGMDEFRISDTVRWTSDFTPPGAEHTVDSNTIFLDHFNQVNQAERTPTSISITAVGDASLSTTVQKFGQTLSLDGSGDYLSIPDSDDWAFGSSFTIDTWVNFSDVTASRAIASQYVDSNNYWTWMYSTVTGGLRFYSVVRDLHFSSSVIFLPC